MLFEHNVDLVEPTCKPQIPMDKRIIPCYMDNATGQMTETAQL
jgi:hypothetical protein